MITANIESRASVGLPFPVSIVAMMIITSMPVTASVNTNVPSGSPSFSARHSACLTNREDRSKDDEQQPAQYQREPNRMGKIGEHALAVDKEHLRGGQIDQQRPLLQHPHAQFPDGVHSLRYFTHKIS